MFDIKKILSRSWHILWAYRMLWVFGFILALAAGAGYSPGNQSNYQFSGTQPEEFRAPDDWQGFEGETFAEVMEEVFRQLNREFLRLQELYPEEFRLGVAVAITALVIILVSSILVAVLRYVAETSAIRMVDEFEESGVKVGFRQAWKYGWNRKAWQLFVVNFLVNLPGLALLIVLALIGWWIVSSLISGVEWAIVNSVIAGSGLAFLAIFITIVLLAVLHVIRDFAWRMIVLDGAGVRDGFRMAWGLLKRQWKNIGLMWLVMIGINIGLGIVFIVLIIPLLFASVVTGLGGVLVALVPSLVTAGVASLFAAPDYWPWIFAAVIGAPFFLIVTFSPVILVSGWQEIYQSSVWTLTYRELKALETVSPEEDAPEMLEPPAGEVQ